MAEVTASLIKELRDRTGIGMGKCKEALQNAGGDIEAAIADLRKSGMASAVKKHGRATNEGAIAVKEIDGTLAIVEVNAETDFVTKNDMFQKFLDEVASAAARNQPQDVDAFLKQPMSEADATTVDEHRATLVQTIGENIQIRRLACMPADANTSHGVYSHMGGKIVAVVEVEGDNSQSGLARDIAMHAAAASPDFLDPDQVPQDVIDHEKDIAAGQVKGKPPEIMEKILTGKVNAFFDQVCLTRQKFIKDDKMTVQEVVDKQGKESGKELKLKSFMRWVVGQ